MNAPLKKRLVIPGAVVVTLLVVSAVLFALRGPNPAKWFSKNRFPPGKILSGAAKICDEFEEDVVPQLNGLDRAKDNCDLVGRGEEIENYLVSIESYAGCHMNTAGEIMAEAKEIMDDAVSFIDSLDEQEEQETARNNLERLQIGCEVFFPPTPPFSIFPVTFPGRHCVTYMKNAALALEDLYVAINEADGLLKPFGEWVEKFKADRDYSGNTKDCYLDMIRDHFDAIKTSIKGASRLYDQTIYFVERCEGCGGKKTEAECAPEEKTTPLPSPKGKGKVTSPPLKRK